MHMNAPPPDQTGRALDGSLVRCAVAIHRKKNLQSGRHQSARGPTAVACGRSEERLSADIYADKDKREFKQWGLKTDFMA